MKPKKPKLKSTQAIKLIKEAREKILGPGLKERIKKAKALPHRFPGNTGIFWDPNWQDGVLDLTQKEIDSIPEEKFVQLQAKYPDAGLARGPR